MSHKPDFTSSQSQVFPQQPHQPVAVRTARGVAMTACRENDSRPLRRARQNARHLFGEAVDEQRMSWLHIVMMDGNARMTPPCFGQRVPKRFALPKVEIESGRQDENLF